MATRFYAECGCIRSKFNPDTIFWQCSSCSTAEKKRNSDLAWQHWEEFCSHINRSFFELFCVGCVFDILRKLDHPRLLFVEMLVVDFTQEFRGLCDVDQGGSSELRGRMMAPLTERFGENFEVFFNENFSGKQDKDQRRDYFLNVATRTLRELWNSTSTEESEKEDSDEHDSFLDDLLSEMIQNHNLCKIPGASKRMGPTWQAIERLYFS